MVIVKKKPVDHSFLRKIIFADKARNAFTHILRRIGPHTKILLPAYIGINDKEGSGVFDPIRQNNIDYEFYNLNLNLSIDIEDFKKKIKDPNVNAVLVIHYFGFLQTDINQIVKICKEQNKYLIEDCAHSLLSEFQGKELGSFGDVSFFSLHKFLSMQNGGILQINNSKLKDIEVNNTKHITEFINYDLKKIANIRRNNYLYLLNKLKNVSSINILYPHLPPGIVPMNFPIFVKNRDQIYFSMNKNGIEITSLYHRIIDQIGEEYVNSHYISKHITNLPIHQDVTYSDIDKMVEELKNVLKEF